MVAYILDVSSRRLGKVGLECFLPTFSGFPDFHVLDDIHQVKSRLISKELIVPFSWRG